MSSHKTLILNLREDLVEKIQAYCRKSGQSTESLIESALSSYFYQRSTAKLSRSSFVMPSYDLGGLMPGVNLDDSAGLLDIMNADEYQDGYTGPYH